ncbi:nucleotidyltransferase family protein [Tenacibaculum sediminilitoris]|uniref:nucleotidyltransferase family protein n=1 Tax=Tenacibaculum sediminilitoris TaxID=1820334 RepID=UPI0038B49019
MDDIGYKLLIVVKDGIYRGLLSIGDVQRSIIGNINLNDTIGSIMRKDYIVSKPQDSIDNVKKLMLKIRSEFMPVIDSDNNIVDVYFWKDLFEEKESQPLKKFNLPVIIMAGGFGTRLRPLTYVIPKPLIPIGEKTMLEEIFSRFGKHGCDEFHISVNYKADLIKYYVKSKNLPYDVSYFEEEQPMGTAGSLSLLKNKIDTTFFVSNCDILIEQDYSEILDYHQKNKNEITMVAALKHFSIPYGTIQTAENGLLQSMEEKPDMTYLINAGLYVLEPHLLNEIPENEFFHITHLIEKVRQDGRKVGVFPVSEKSWRDIGNWNEYNREVLSSYTNFN